MNYRFFTIILVVASLNFAAELENMRFRAAKQLVNSGEYDAAIEEYRAILLDEPESIEAYFEAGQVRFLQKRWNAAVQNYKLAVERNPEHWAAHQGMAQAYEKMSMPEKAIAQWRLLANNGPATGKDHAEAQIKRLLGLSEPPPAPATPAPKVVAPTPALPADANFNQALELYRQGKWNESLQYLRKVLAAVPGHAGAYYYAGVCRYNLNDYPKAEYNLKRGVDFPELGFNAYYYLGRISEKSGNKAEAIKNYRQYLPLTTSEQGKKEVTERIARLSATEAKTTDVVQDSAPAAAKFDVEPVHIQKFGDLYLVQSEKSGAGAHLLQEFLTLIAANEFNKSIEVLKKVNLEFPGSANALAADYNLLTMYHYLGLYAQAAPLGKSLQKLQPQEPWRSSIDYLLAEAQLGVSEYEGLQKKVSELVTGGKLGPTSVQKSKLLERLAAALQKQKDVPEQLQKLLSQETNPAKKIELWLRLARAYEAAGQKKAQLEAYEKLNSTCQPDLGENCRKGIYALAEMYYQQSNWSSAYNTYQKLVKNYPDKQDSPWGLYQIANILRHQSKYAEAAEAYQSLIEEFPHSYWADQAKWNKEDVIWRANNKSHLRLK